MMIRHALLPAFLGLAAILHFGCDASGGIGGSGVNGASEGTVTEYGSIWVNGVRWHIDEADLEFDGHGSGEGDLELGMVVRVFGDIDPSTSEGTAERVVQDFALRGPIAAIDSLGPDSAELSVLGRTARVDGATRFDPDAPSLSLASLSVGDHVSLSGHDDADGTLRVSYLERATPIEAEVAGTVSGFDGFESFQLGSVTVEIDGATDYVNLPWGVVNGAPVVVTGIATGLDTVLADEIRLDIETLFSGLPADLPSFGVQGYLQEYQGLDDLKIGVHQIDASTAVFEGGDLQDLLAGERVHVTGERVGGTLVADRIVFDDEDEDEEEEDDD